MLRNAIERTGPVEVRLTRSELFQELAKMHRRSFPQPGAGTADPEGLPRSGARRMRFLRVAAAAPLAKEVARKA